MELLLITPPRTKENELSLVQHFLERGLHKLHIRKPAYETCDYERYIKAIPASFHHRLVIHGAFELVNSFPSTGVHLRSDDRQNTALLQSVQQLKPASLSTSFHGWQEIMENTTHYDYVFISPVFDSISKQGYKAAIDLGGHRQLSEWALKHKKQLPRIAGLGGVSAATLLQLYENGFEGAALLGAIWESADPIAAFSTLQQANDNPAGS